MTDLEWAHLYRDGDLWVVVQTGMPEQAVQIGVGETLEAAAADLKATPIQSTGIDNGIKNTLEWAYGAEWISSDDLPRARSES